MNPEQPAPPPLGGNYDFIINPSQPPKPKLGGAISKNAFIMRLVVIIGGAVVLMIVLALVVNLFLGSKTNLDDIVSIATTEEEIVRVSKEGRKAIAQPIKNAAVSTEFIITSQQQSYLAFLDKYGRQVDDKEIVLKKDATTDQKLATAKQTSTFDSTFTLIMRSQLESYGTSLKEAFNHATNQEERALLSKHYKEIQLLLEQWPL